jgi:hypothetical protein
MTHLLSHTALSLDEIDMFVACLFDKDPPTVQPDNLPPPYCSENPPPSVRILAVFDSYLIGSCHSRSAF